MIKPGITIRSQSDVSFIAWAPYARKAAVLLFTDTTALTAPPGRIVELDQRSDGLWGADSVDCTGFRYYRYRFLNCSGTHEEFDDVCDIWGCSAAPDSAASELVDITSDVRSYPADSGEKYRGAKDYKNPWKGSRYTDAVIYEMHIRDWAHVETADGSGTFLDIAEGNTVIRHIQSLGVTHVQLLPCFDYAQHNDDVAYNWGYNPYNYNVPEGRYVRGMKDGCDAVAQFRALVQAFHKAGIAVNMDVVYNHTSDTGRYSIYDMTAPRYFYRLKQDGSYSNGTGCGNELATERDMVRTFILESLKHWMLDYHINGFRFDLMGCHEISTMREIYSELKKIDPNVMVYGEPWTGGESLVRNGVSKERIDECSLSDDEDGVACFGDSYRDAIKGAEFLCFNKGEVQGVFNDVAICEGLTGSPHLTRRMGRILNYAECHDNYTLFDKLAMVHLGTTCFSGNLFARLNDDSLNTVKKEDVLAAGYVILAQGVPFLDGGQEFLRTKRGDSNSYQSSDEVNGINFSFASEYSDVLDSYRGLLALRAANRDAFGANREAFAHILQPGVIEYKTGTFTVYFNATDSDIVLPADGCSIRVNVDSGSAKEIPLLAGSVGVDAKSFVILKRG